jgi:hypothetical protein
MRRSKKGLRCVELEGTYECQRYSEFSCTGWILLRRFIEGFLKISKPMTELLKKDKQFE